MKKLLSILLLFVMIAGIVPAGVSAATDCAVTDNVIDITDKALTCTLSVRCDTILQNIGWIDSEKVDIVPKDGVIFAEKTVTFYEGESVFNLLQREMEVEYERI